MIEFEGVSKRYPDGTIAVTDFSLAIASRSVVALVGSSGSGKTTLLRMINRMVEPTAGRVLIDGADIRERGAVQLRRSIGYVMQQGGLLPHRSVLDNVSTVPRLTGATRAAAKRRASELLELVGLDAALGTRFPAQLSGGQQQRVGVARALAADPNILLMDEPFGAVDPIVRRELQAELLRLQAELGKTIVFVTHDVDEALRVGDEIVLLEAGARIAQHDTPQSVLAAPANEFVREFVGANLSERKLRVKRVGDRTVALDEHGTPVGVLEE
ncbi:ABC transporter ATP-binding protein [Leucobacter sp. HY1910]